MPGTMYPRGGHPLSKLELKRAQLKGPLYEYLEFFALNDKFNEKFDFRGDAISGDDWAVANGGGASAASFAINVQRSGVIRATTGTGNGDTASASLISPAIYYGDANCGASFYWEPITAVTETRIELGFVDVVPGSTKPVVNVLATPSVNTSVVDTALRVYDHTSSTTTNQLTTIGSSITAAKATFTPLTTVAAATPAKTRIQIIGNRVYLWEDGILKASLATGTTDYIEGGSAIALWAYVRASSASSKSLDIDLIHVWQDR